MEEVELDEFGFASEAYEELSDGPERVVAHLLTERTEGEWLAMNMVQLLDPTRWEHKALSTTDESEVHSWGFEGLGVKAQVDHHTGIQREDGLIYGEKFVGAITAYRGDAEKSYVVGGGTRVHAKPAMAKPAAPVKPDSYQTWGSW